MQDGKQPGTQIRSPLPERKPSERAFQTILHQVVGGQRVAAHERAGVAPQAGDVLDDLVAGAGHVARASR